MEAVKNHRQGDGAETLVETCRFTRMESELALVAATGLHQLRVALQCVDDMNGAKPGLRQRAHDHLEAPVHQNVPRLPGGLLNSLQHPVLGFQNQEAAPGVHHHKVGV